MDPALATLDFAKAGAILADMIASCLAAGALPFEAEGPDDHDLENRRSTPVEAGLHIRSPVDAGAGPLEPGKHGRSASYLSDAKGAEGFERFAVEPGEIRIGDRGYISCRGLRHVLHGGGDFLIRAGWNALRWRCPDGSSFDLFAALRQAGDRLDQWITVVDPKNDEPLRVRLIAARKSPEAAEKDRRHIRQQAKRKGKTPDARTLEAADWIILITSLEGPPATDVLALYRLRWQIELAFKRLKSLAGLDLLPARSAALGRAWIAAKLIIATLIGWTIQGFRSPPVKAAMP